MPSPSTAPIRVAIVEDEETTREALHLLIGAAPGFACEAVFETAEDALDLLPKIQPDVILMDIQLPGMDGIECIGLLRKILPASQIIMLTVLEDYDRIFESLAAGASGRLFRRGLRFFAENRARFACPGCCRRALRRPAESPQG
jgi:DNA-binding NarL/FixJ family response regulator